MPNASSRLNENEIDVRQIIGVLIDNRWWIAAITGLSLVVSIAYACFATPVYQSDVLIQVDSRSAQTAAGAPQLQALLAASNSAAITEIALLTSRTVVGQAVSDLQLDTQIGVRRFPVIGTPVARAFVPTSSTPVAKTVLGLVRYGWGGESLTVSRFEVGALQMDASFTLTALANGLYQLQDPRGATVLHGAVGQVASAAGVTLLVDGLRAHAGTTFELRRIPTLSAIKRLQGELQASEQGKDSGIILLSLQGEDPVRANAILRDVSETYVRKNIEQNAANAANGLRFVREQIPRIKDNLDQAQTELKRYQSSAGSVDLALQTKTLLEQAVQVDTALQQVRLQQADAQTRFQPGQPAMKALADQAAQLEERRQALHAQIDTLPDTQQRLLQLTREVEVSTQTYTALLAQAQQLDVARASTVGSVRIVDSAAVDTTTPVKPRRALIVLAGLIGGIVLSVLAVIVRQMLTRGVEEPAELEAMGLPVYASVPVTNVARDARTFLRDAPESAPRHARLLAIDYPTDLASEAIRSLRTSLHFARLEAANNIVMIGGASPGVGKTFVAANLAAVFAQSGQRVLLVDADMRRGVAHGLLGSTVAPGLSEVLSDGMDPLPAIRTEAGHPNLDFLPRGRVPANPAELLLQARFGALLDELKDRYDLVILDTPPFLAVTDASIIGRHAGTCLMVARFGQSQMREIRLAEQRLRHSDVRITGIVFNAIQRRSHGFLSWGQYAYHPEE